MHFANLVFKNLLDVVNSKFAYKETQFAKKKVSHLQIRTFWYQPNDISPSFQEKA